MYKYGWKMQIHNADLQCQQNSTNVDGGKGHQLHLTKMCYDPKVSRHGARNYLGAI